MKTKMKSTLFLGACVAASLIGMPVYSQSTDPVVDGDTPESLSAPRSATIEDIIEILSHIKICVNDGWLVVQLPYEEERISIYSTNGTELYRTETAIPANTETRVVELNSIHATSGEVVIVRGSSGWGTKIVI